MSRPFVLDLGWGALLGDLGLRPADLLRLSNLPEDLLARDRPSVSPEGFNRLFDTLVAEIDSDAPGLALGQALAPESFSPPLFAAYCSENLEAAARRRSLYKPLVVPLNLDVNAMGGGLELIFGAEPGIMLPPEYIAAELVFLVSLARRATRHAVRPVAVEFISPPASPEYAVFFEHQITQGPFNRIVFTPTDSKRPFLSANPALFNSFAPDLRARLDQIERNASTRDRVRTVLMEALPGGHPDVGTVAKRLGMSPRTLQRRLGTEETSFQTVLQSLRERLARDYLEGTGYTNADISFLLGYEDPNSFIRAFHGWTGTTPEAYRSASQLG